jgi:hypothetical protein
MALNYDTIENENAFRVISKEEYDNPSDKRDLFQRPKFEKDGKYYEMTTECNMLILLMGLVIGIPELTEYTYVNVYNRISVMEKINGSYLVSENPKTSERVSNYFTIEMVKNNVGIKTNGIRLSESEFKNKVMDSLFENKKI